jgi:hypothetical protein
VAELMAGISLSGLDLSFLHDSPPVAPTAAERARKARRNTPHPARSDLPCPYIAPDRVEYKSTITGEQITSRRQHREHLKRHGYVERGSDEPKIASKEVKHQRRRKQLTSDLRDAYQMHLQGFRAPKAASAEDAGFASVDLQGVTRADAPEAKPKIITSTL